MRIVAVAHDLAPSEGVGACAEELQKRGWAVEKFLLRGKSFGGNLSDIASTCQQTDVVLCGFSSSEKLAQEEITAARAAIEKGIPLALYADTFGVYRSPWTDLMREKAQLVFVQTEPECSETRLVFPNAIIVASGSPIYERIFFAARSRSEAREKLGLHEEDRMILIPLGKTIVENGALVALVLQALADMGVPCRPIFTLHPGDTSDPNQYKVVETYPSFQVAKIAMLGRADGITSQEALSGADLVITCASATAIEAACMRIPVIDFVPEVLLARMELVRGSRRWERSELGISRKVSWDVEQLRQHIRDLLSPGGYNAMKAVHEDLYPKPEQQGLAARKMADSIVAMSHIR